jgi:hypothetical protein
MALSVNRRWIAALPVLVIFLSLLQILPFLLPDIGDNLTESYQPVKTLLTTSLVFLEPLADTKPDGMTVSLLICALANYVTIVLEGVTAGSAIRLDFFCVASLSCKELTSTTMMLPYLGLAIAALASWRRNPAEGKRNVRLLLLSAIEICPDCFTTSKRHSYASLNQGKRGEGIR